MKEKGKSRKMLLTAMLVIAMPLVLTGIIAFVLLQLAADGQMSVFFGTMCMIFVLLVVLAVIFRMTRQLLNRIHSLVGNLDQIADGTLSFGENKLAERNDEIGQMMRSINSMVASFAQIITSVKNATESLVKVSEDFANYFQDMETSMHQVGNEINAIGANTLSQSEKTREIGNQAMDMGNAIDVIVQNIDLMTQGADKMKEYSEAAEKILNGLQEMNRNSCREAVDVLAQMDMVNRLALQIRGVTETVTAISKKTNLLALNAGIEAAKAGESGRGFTVVANEIRTLAGQTREASAQINSIANELIANASAGTEAARKVAVSFEEQAQKIDRANEFFDSMNCQIRQINGSIGGIDGGVRELKDAREVVGGGIAKIAKTVKANSQSTNDAHQAVDAFEGIVAECRKSTEQVRAVSDGLLADAEKYQL